MTTELQLDFFTPKPEKVDYLEEELKKLKESHDKVRKGMFARLNELSKLIILLSKNEEIQKDIAFPVDKSQSE